MTTILTDITPSMLIPAMEANLQEAFTRFGQSVGATFFDTAQATWFVSDIPLHFCNGVVRTQITKEVAETQIDEIVSHAKAHNMPLAWLVCPSTRPANLASFLKTRDFYLDDSAPGLAMNVQELSEVGLPSGLVVKEVASGEEMQDWIRLLVIGSTFPESVSNLLFQLYQKYGFRGGESIRYYLGILNGEPVSTSLLFLSGGVAGIYDVITLPHVRKQGIGTALTVVPLLEARSLGYSIGTLQSTQMGLGVYRRLGFREYCTFDIYLRDQ